MWRVLSALALLGACASVTDPLSDVGRAQQRLDMRGLGFEVRRVPGESAYALRALSRPEGAEGVWRTDPMAGALAAAPSSCRVETLTRIDGETHRVDYDCD